MRVTEVRENRPDIVIQFTHDEAVAFTNWLYQKSWSDDDRAVAELFRSFRDLGFMGYHRKPGE